MSFYPARGVTPQGEQASTRVFYGDGTHLLRVPGLVGMPTKVRIGSQEIPLAVRERVPMALSEDPMHNQYADLHMPLIAVDVDDNDCPVLLRNTRSNNGIFQDGAAFYVTGEWADAEAPLAIAS